VITVTGELDVSNTAQLFDCLDGAIEAGLSQIVVDIAYLTFMDSAGLAVLVGANERMKLSGGTLTILSPAASIKRLLAAVHVVPSLTVREAA
jgi:anti-anti-sigma factor